MLGHDVPALKNVADYVRPMHIELSLYCIVSVKTHPPPRTPTPGYIQGIVVLLPFTAV